MHITYFTNKVEVVLRTISPKHFAQQLVLVDKKFAKKLQKQLKRALKEDKDEE